MNLALEHEHNEARQVSCRHKCSSEGLSGRAHISRHDGVMAEKYMARMAILDTKPRPALSFAGHTDSTKTDGGNRHQTAHKWIGVLPRGAMGPGDVCPHNNLSPLGETLNGLMDMTDPAPPRSCPLTRGACGCYCCSAVAVIAKADSRHMCMPILRAKPKAYSPRGARLRSPTLSPSPEMWASLPLGMCVHRAALTKLLAYAALRLRARTCRTKLGLKAWRPPNHTFCMLKFEIRQGGLFSCNSPISSFAVGPVYQNLS